jgi:cytochrome bd-type quinol oxidase subunit 2
MVRLTTTGNVFSGIGLTLLAVTIFLKFILDSLSATPDQLLYPFYVWLIALGILAIVVVIGVINTFTEMTGFVHPDDKMYSNMLVYVMALGTLLVCGLLQGVDTTIQGYLFNMGTMIVIAYIFLFVFVFFGGKIAKGAEEGQVKEMTSRFMLVSLILGVAMAGAHLFLNIIYSTFSYGWAAAVLMVFAVALVLLMVLYMGRKYEPVGK